jgi:serine phosphatase RsbU (regulator of sigma subunit)
MVGRDLFEVFPDITSRERVAESRIRQAMAEAVRTGRPVVLGMLRYDLALVDRGAVPEPRYWVSTVVPVPEAAARVRWLVYSIHDVSAFAAHVSDDGDLASAGGGQEVTKALSAVAAVAERSRLSDASLEAERQLGMAVQSVMLPSQVPATLSDKVAVRYRPASEALRVGGDWYDVADVGDGRLAVAVGDVVGHGLRAAALMGQLRSALRALTLADIGPASAMVALDRMARTSAEATASTAVKVVIDPELDLLTYSSAGHLPSVLVRADGTLEMLDQATGPPLAVTERASSRPLGTAKVAPGDTLVLYTDGLVERRDEDLDLGIARLAKAVVRHPSVRKKSATDHRLYLGGHRQSTRPTWHRRRSAA